MVKSMTGWSSVQGGTDSLSWTWELRSVNGRGLDLRMRLAEGAEALEPALRKRLAERCARGNISLNLRIQPAPGAALAVFDRDQLERAILAARAAEELAGQAGLALRPASPAELLALRGVMDAGRSSPAEALPSEALLADFERLVVDFLETRAREGRALEAILRAQIDTIASLVAAAREGLGPRTERQQATLRAQLALLLENEVRADEARITQELALLAVKSDVAEELDRLDAHVEAARELLGAEGAVGRKLDFLMQEFNREANTLCSKSGDPALTRIGLDLKAVIDQMREQVQNVE